MPFCADESFSTPEDSTPIWRYMDIGPFLTMFQNKALYFALARELRDPWERVRPSFLTRGIQAKFGDGSGVESVLDQTAAQAVVNCWHQNACESVAMWDLYCTGNEGIAIQSTVGRLKKALADEPCRVWIAEVQYCDHGDKTRPASKSIHRLTQLVSKRLCYAHERELRAVILSPADRVLSKSETGPLPFVLIDPPHGLQVHVDLAELIERIFVSPHYPTWAIPALQKIVDDAGLAISVELSDLLRGPASSECEFLPAGPLDTVNSA